MEQQSLKQPDSGIISEDRISEVMALAERLRQASGGILDEEHIEAIEEATGTPRETIRVLVRSMESNIRLPVWDRLRSQLATLDSRLKNSVGVGTLGVISGVLFALSTRMIVGGQMAASFAVLSATLALIVSLHGRDRIASGILGALWGAIHFFSYQVAATFIALIVRGPSPEMGWGVFPLFVIAGFFFSLVGRHFWDTLRQTLGWKDPSQQRKALVQQLMEIQDRLKAEERNAAYLSLDVVGSTAMKTRNDPMSVEFTMTEYHSYVEAEAMRFGGRIHSTAGDGVICVFDHPHDAFKAGRSILAGLVEFNAFRNRLNEPIQLRGGLHIGAVAAPGQDAAKVDFAHTLDLTAHLQHAAPVGAMAVSEDAAVHLPGGLNAIGSESLEVDGLRARVWRPRSIALAAAPVRPAAR